MRGDVVVRDAVSEDAERLVEIYRPYVETTAITFEYDVPTVGEFRGRMERTMEKYPYLVAEMDDAALDCGLWAVRPMTGRWRRQFISTAGCAAGA